MSNLGMSFHACFRMVGGQNGRPYERGGVAILWPSKVNFAVLPCQPVNKKSCAVKVTVYNCSFVLINVYFPKDNYLNNFVTEKLRNFVDS